MLDVVSKNSIHHIVVGGCLTVRNFKTYPTVILANAGTTLTGNVNPNQASFLRTPT